jgi:hypothetical protein
VRSVPFALALLALAGCATVPPGPPRLSVAWTATGLANPESVQPSADGRFLYVSNVNGEGDAIDGNGFIARLGNDGAILEREWARGLDAPKGLGLAGNTLYVADVTRLVALDAASGAITARHEIAGAKFLNDVAIDADGTVLVSDSATARIHGWRDGAMSVWLEDERLRAVNGLLPERERVVVTTMRGLLLAVDRESKAITVLAQDLGNADGVVALGDGEYLVGEWPGRLFHVRADGTNTTLLDSRERKTYLNDFLRIGDRVIVPNWEPSTVTAFDLDR